MATVTKEEARLKRTRTSMRGVFSKAVSKLITYINENDALLEENVIYVNSSFTIVETRFNELKKLDDEILDIITNREDSTETEITEELEQCDNYVEKFSNCSQRKTFFLNKVSSLNKENNINKGSINCESYRPNLPPYKIKPFGGDLTEWLSFWNSFKRIHLDSNIRVEDKFTYLMSSLIQDSKAYRAVEKYPLTPENYPKAIASLQNRFGREELLIEVYSRELLKLVLNRPTNLSILYDSLETQLNALESLGLTSDRYAAILYPLVESCLSENLLRIWQRKRSNISINEITESHQTTSLQNLMEFLRTEVEAEERVSLAAAGFNKQSAKQEKSKHSSSAAPPIEVPSASELVNSNHSSGNKTFKGKICCAFCNKSHKHVECFKARNMSLDDKIKYLNKAGLCTQCLRGGHSDDVCYSRLKCFICMGKHVVFMCPKAKINNGNKLVREDKPLIENNLSNNTSETVFLQTLLVKVKGKNKELVVRAIIDSGSQRSYITKNLVRKMGYDPIYQQNLTHLLFGGGEELVSHNCYKVRLVNFEGNYACNFEALDQDIICKYVGPVREGPWISKLEENNIVLKDRVEGPIEILLGADVFGKLLTGRTINLDSGLTAIETLLGWTVVGKVKDNSVNLFSYTNTMTNNLDPTSKLWELGLREI